LAWRAAGPFDPQKGAARSWLYAILRNCALSILRDENRFTSDEDTADRSGAAQGQHHAGALICGGESAAGDFRPTD
jgi:DNA-directed RNA polymerase specialized sigma24 family protein